MPFPEPDAHANAEGSNKSTFPHTADVVQLGQGKDDGKRYHRPVEKDFTDGHGFAGDLCQGKSYTVCRHGQDIGGNIQKNTGTEKQDTAQHIQEFDRIHRICGQ